MTSITCPNLGLEFNEKLRRNDGEFVVKFLHGRLEQDLTDWFYDRVCRLFDIIPESAWSDRDRFMREFRSRNEVSCFQAVEAAIVARDSGYVPADRAEWFADWCLRLSLGVAAPDAKQHRFPHYWNRDQDKRADAFSAALASVLPETEDLHFFICVYTPLLRLLAKASVAAAFIDPATAKATASEHNLVDTRLQASIRKGRIGRPGDMIRGIAPQPPVPPVPPKVPKPLTPSGQVQGKTKPPPTRKRQDGGGAEKPA
jgi:hypothetical protein